LQYDKFNAAYKTYFSKDLPAREPIGVSSFFAAGILKCKLSPATDGMP